MTITFFEVFFTPQIIVSLLVILGLIIFSLVVSAKLKKYDYRDAPSKFIVVLELLVGFVNDFCRENLGERKYKAYAPYMLTLFLYLLVANVVGMFGISVPTSSWSVTIALALVSGIMIYYTRMRERGFFGFFKAFAEPIPVMIPLNIIGIITTPLSMSIRLLVNMISGAAFAILVYGFLGWFAVVVAPAFHGIFDIFFGVIQAFVFFLLTVINVQLEIAED